MKWHKVTQTRVLDKKVDMEHEKKLQNTQVSLAGEFAVLSQLALKGYDANMTLGNTKGVDILVSHPTTGRMFQLEVKTNYRNSRNKASNSRLFGKSVSGWIMKKVHEQIKLNNLFYCFVNIGKRTNIFKFYIVPSKVVAKYVKESHQLWLKANKKNKDSNMRVFRIGLKGASYLIRTPTAERYEDNWEFKR